MDAATLITTSMEIYSELILLLFTPFRTLNDIQDASGSFTKKLREVFRAGGINQESIQFLQNIQDAKANCFRAGRPDDLLQTTEPFMPADSAFDHNQSDEKEDDEEECPGLEGAELDALLELLGEGSDQAEDGEGNNCVLPESLNLAPMRQKGRHEACYKHLAEMQTTNPTGTTAFEVTGNTYMEEDEGGGNSEEELDQVSPKKKDLVAILGSKNSRRTYSFADIIKNSEPVQLLEANRSARSIIDWGRKAKLDKEQRRAFEIPAASFVLSFYNDSEGELFSQRDSKKFKHEKKQLQRLVEVTKRGSEQLVCLLHGPGGCGKTTVIDLVVAYGKEYCRYMENYEFTRRTIVVTAMTGVAATLLLGETTHSALYLNQKNPLNQNRF